MRGPICVIWDNKCEVQYVLKHRFARTVFVRFVERKFANPCIFTISRFCLDSVLRMFCSGGFVR